MIDRVSPLKVSLIFLFAAAVSLFSWPAFPHPPDPKKFDFAVVRSQDAAKIISLLAELPQVGFPKELMDKVEGVGVFPRVTKETLLFQQSVNGYGVVCVRAEKGWTLPAFYRFMGGGYTSTFVNEDQISVIVLFMDKEALAWFEKGRVGLTEQEKVVAGPVGTISDAQKAEIAGAHVIGYIYDNSKLQGSRFSSGSKSFVLNPDNNINKPLYGMKGREVLAGKQVDVGSIPRGITAYQEALQKYYSRP
jgi:lipid-binding SYLF domain-containing protein